MGKNKLSLKIKLVAILLYVIVVIAAAVASFDPVHLFPHDNANVRSLNSLRSTSKAIEISANVDGQRERERENEGPRTAAF